MPHPEIDLYNIAAEIWGAILGLELKPNNPVDAHDPGERVVTGCVQITGDWSGAVTVQCAESFARTAAALMFAMEPDEVVEEELSDTIGELANMTGGNVKSLLAGSLQLSLPAVTSGRDYQVSVPGAAVTDRVALDCDGELIVVSLLQRQGT
ncbi:chemotaxis protein CheX [Nitriliruptoraceae bacterium ZYF776]|nr:chemotaxis protein CheX [Profundirhabdus halotolerans]